MWFVHALDKKMHTAHPIGIQKLCERNPKRWNCWTSLQPGYLLVNSVVGRYGRAIEKTTLWLRGGFCQKTRTEQKNWKPEWQKKHKDLVLFGRYSFQRKYRLSDTFLDVAMTCYDHICNETFSRHKFWHHGCLWYLNFYTPVSAKWSLNFPPTEKWRWMEPKVMEVWVRRFSFKL